MEDDEKSFTIVDKRHGREDADDDEARAAPPAETETADAAPSAEPSEQPLPELPAMDFSTFILSLSTSALYHLGLVAEQEGAPPPPPDLPMARQTIDLLEMLQEKTRGNLTPEEGKLFESMLYDLRMHFVEVQRRS